MLGLIYSALLLLVLAGLIGGLLAWRTRERVARLERTVEQLQHRLQRAGEGPVASEKSEAEPVSPPSPVSK